ncbi:MAG: PEP-CTERM-box response regulator transcription factor [bacterium]
MSKRISPKHSPKPGVLIVDDEKAIRDQIRWSLLDEYQIFDASNSDEALTCVREHSPEVITLDLMLSPNGQVVDGLELLEKISNQSTQSIIIVITGREEKELALKAISAGAHDYFLKPFDLAELKTVIRRALWVHNLEAANKVRFFDAAESGRFHEIIGTCPAMLKIFDVINRVSSKDVDVIIQGESGTGKELVARALHYFSNRRQHPLVTINCASIPDNLIEAELFGHEKGAFTGAHIQRKGKFEIANHGTIFLDEIGDLSLNLQVKLLRFLQQRVVERIGGRESIELDVRVIAATNKILEQEIEKGAFRDDLYYRLCVIKIDLPPLRERGEDISLLADYMLYKSADEYGSKVRGFTIEAKNAMAKYSWPGNVRELENKIKRAAIMSESRVIDHEDLNLGLTDNTQKTLRERISEIEKQSLEEALFHNRGIVAKAADALKVNRTTFYEMVKKYDINIRKYRFPKTVSS